MPEKCKLCLINDADQTGSYIVSAFYVKPVIGGRNSEEGYILTDGPLQDYTKDEGATPLKEDFILCRGCEQRFAYVESYVAEELPAKFRKPNFASNFMEIKIRERNRLKIVSPVRLNSYAYQAFIYSIVWRASVSTSEFFKKFIVKGGMQEELRQVLNDVLPIKEDYRGVVLEKKKWFKILDEQFKSRFRFPFIVVVPQSAEIIGAGLISFDLHESDPYSLIIEDSIIFFNIKKESAKDNLRLLGIVNRKVFYNIGGESIKILMISDEFWRQIRKRLVKEAVGIRVANFYKGAETVLIEKHGYLPRGYKIFVRAAFVRAMDLMHG